MTEYNHEEHLHQELEQEEKEHDHHNPTAAAMTNHIVASMSILNTKLHQYHWYVKGPHFFSLHEKFEDLYNENNEYFDLIAETLLAMDAKPASTTEQFLKFSMITEDGADKYLPAEKMVERLVDDYDSIRSILLRAITLGEKEDRPVLVDVLTEYKRALDKDVWMLQAFLGKSAGEDLED